MSTDMDRKFDVEYKKAIDYLKGQLGRISLPMVRTLGARQFAPFVWPAKRNKTMNIVGA